MAKEIDEKRLAMTIGAIEMELRRAMSLHPPMNSPHEGYATILEELDELWEPIKRNHGYAPATLKEAIQVAAMGARYLYDLGGAWFATNGDQDASSGRST